MRRFVFEGAEWEVSRGDVGIGVMFGAPPKLSRWLVTFTRVSAPDGGRFVGYVGARYLSKLDDSELCQALKSAIAASAK